MWKKKVIGGVRREADGGQAVEEALSLSCRGRLIGG